MPPGEKIWLKEVAAGSRWWTLRYWYKVRLAQDDIGSGSGCRLSAEQTRIKPQDSIVTAVGHPQISRGVERDRRLGNSGGRRDSKAGGGKATLVGGSGGEVRLADHHIGKYWWQAD